MWIYEQKTGRLLHDNTLIAIGYAGYGPGKNNPAFQGVKNIGPIPKGLYQIGAPYNSKVTGLYTLVLTPDIHNNMFGRTDFRIHGDSKSVPGTASHGCIIMPREVRESMWNSRDLKLEVV